MMWSAKSHTHDTHIWDLAKEMTTSTKDEGTDKKNI